MHSHHTVPTFMIKTVTSDYTAPSILLQGRMAPGAEIHTAASLNGTAVAEGSKVDEWQRGTELVKNLSVKKDLREPPVQAYEDAPKVPYEFVTEDPAKVPTRGWGEDDASQLPLKDFALPLIDMSPLTSHHHQPIDAEAAKKVIAEIGRACEDWGFFQTVNHGIPETLLDRLVEVGHEFFRLPLEEKQVYAPPPGENEGYGRLDFDPQVRFWSDNLRLTVRPRPVPEKDRIPDKPLAYRAVIEEYTQEVERLLQVLWKSLSQYLGLETCSLKDTQEHDAGLVIRVNYYPKCPEPERVLGIKAHKDWGCMTVLLQDEVGGLQVQKPGTNVWVDVKPKKGSLVINIANQVEILSNGRFHSAMHRALVNRSKPRLSVAVFALPGPKCIISPLQELLDKTQQLPRYKQLHYGDSIPVLRADLKAGLRPHLRYEINRN